jgi:DNA-binding transcriptional MerR regulator
MRIAYEVDLRPGSQVAAEVGVNALRCCERRGLLREPPRRDSGYRSCAVGTVATVRFIKEAQKLGFTKR